MNPLWILLIGMAVVVGGVLALRLHAFLALLLGAIVVALLTPYAQTYRFGLRPNALEVVSYDPVTRAAALKAGKAKLLDGAPLVVLRSNASGDVAQVATARVAATREGQVVASLVGNDPAAEIRPGDLIVEPAQAAAARKAAGLSLGERIAVGFGETALNIGILIALASIVGEALLLSGAAERIVVASRRALGDERAGLAFLVSGFVLGIPVFFDTVFYLLIPLGKVMRARSGRDYLLYVLCIVAGATMTHSLVPPTPGPLYVASELKVDLATMIIAGLVVSAFTSAAGYAYAKWANRRWDVPLREGVGLKPDELAAIASRDEATLPPLWLSLTPILLPVFTIALAAVLTSPGIAASVAASGAWAGRASDLVVALGDKNIAMAVAAGIALLMVVGRRRPPTGADGGGDPFAKSVSEALASAGVIILITSAGGAFGYVLRQTDIATTIKGMVPVNQFALIPLAFLVTTTIRIAQGSATVAMVTAAGVVSPLAAAGGLGFHPVYLALAIGCGSKPVMWMNDSGFWIIGKMSGFTEAETLKSATVMMAIMGVVGLVVTVLAAWLLPMV